VFDLDCKVERVVYIMVREVWDPLDVCGSFGRLWILCFGLCAVVP
jgi:hypothetical protein